MRNSRLYRRAVTGIVTLAPMLLVAGVQVGTTPSSTKVLQFPADQYVGSLCVEDPCLGSTYLELGRDRSLPYGLDPRRVALGGDWDFAGLAQGDVAVPAGRNVRLTVMLGLKKEDARRVATWPPLKYKMLHAERYREDPLDLSGLSALEPNDLYSLTVHGLVRRANADQCVLMPICRLTGLQILGLHGTGVTDKGMEQLRELRSLRALELGEELSIRNQGLAVLKDLPNLEYIDLGTGATDAGFKHLGQLSGLRWLRIRTGRIWGPGLAELANLPRLERLCIWGTSEISDRHVKYLESLTHLKSLTLWGVADRLTDAGLASIGNLKSLEELYFIRTNPRFTPAGVAHLRDLKNLRKVDFAQAWAGPEGTYYGDEVPRQLAGMPNLESLQGISYLSAEGMKALATSRNLKCLGVTVKDRWQGYDGPTGVSYLQELGALEELTLTGGKSLSDEEVACLESLGNLRHLRIGLAEVTDSGMASIGKLRRLEHLMIGTHGVVTKRGLNELNALTNLQSLDVSTHSDAAPAIDETTLDFSGLTRLRRLELAGFAMEDADMACLGNLRNLEWLMLQNNTLPETALRHLKDLSALKNLRLGRVDCSDGSGLACLGGLRSLRDLFMEGRITDRALRRLASLPAAWSVTAWTDEPIRRETIEHLKQTLPVVEYIHISPRPVIDRPASGPSSGQRGRTRGSPPRSSRPTPQRPRRRR